MVVLALHYGSGHKAVVNVPAPKVKECVFMRTCSGNEDEEVSPRGGPTVLTDRCQIRENVLKSGRAKFARQEH